MADAQITPMAINTRHFRQENENLWHGLKTKPEQDFSQATHFKGWTINHILKHLMVWNQAIVLAVNNTDAFAEFAKPASVAALSGTLNQFEHALHPDLEGQNLLNTWYTSAEEVIEVFQQLDPKDRVSWIGPSMSARSAITARLMETWAHGQAIYDQFNQLRPVNSGLKDIAFLGMNTFKWSFQVNGLTPPDSMPFVELYGPSNEYWQWGEERQEEKITGSAESFCQVVTQTRHIQDTSLIVTGPIAEQWMSIAQCFAGRAESPPRPGSRTLSSSL